MLNKKMYWFIQVSSPKISGKGFICKFTFFCVTFCLVLQSLTRLNTLERKLQNRI